MYVMFINELFLGADEKEKKGKKDIERKADRQIETETEIERLCIR